MQAGHLSQCAGCMHFPESSPVLLIRQATTRHPYAKYGYAAAFGLGLTVYALVTINRVEDVHQQGVAARQSKK